jgi:hypothetical protein
MRSYTTSSLIAFIILGLACSLTCSDTFDQVWRVEYTVSNQTSTNLTVRVGSYFFGVATAPVRVPSGSKKRLAYYEEFLGPPPDAARTFTCVSVHRDSDSLLVFQLAPVSNNQWELNRQAEFQHQYTLELTDAKLHKNGIPSRCGEITGIVTDSLSMLPLKECNARAYEDVPHGEFGAMEAGTNPSGTYSLMWYGDVPAREMRFSSPGHQCRVLRVPAEIDSVAPKRYVANMALPRNPLLEDSLRWGNCP